LNRYLLFVPSIDSRSLPNVLRNAAALAVNGYPGGLDGTRYGPASEG